ncbi:MAG: hypothetical protein JRN39_01205 [Nitrososphaerota archaeon]|nr:hypothetical protein [Nitrososphaerota archaeon]
MSARGVKFEKTPTILLVRGALSKARHPYFTFVGSEAIDYISESLQERVKQGEKLIPQSPLLAFDPRGARKNRFLRTTLAKRDIKEAITKAGFTWRPYVLRAHCDTNIIMAESKGLISHPTSSSSWGTREKSKLGIQPTRVGFHPP